MLKTTALLLALAAPAGAATITEVAGPGTGTKLALAAGDFKGIGTCGFGRSVINDGCSPAAKSDPTADHAYGRFDPLGGEWWDSQDLAFVDWTVHSGTAFTSVTFALTDAFDQKASPKFGLLDSNFALAVDGTLWSIAERQANASINWITVDFGKAVTSASIHFFTRTNDGFSISSATVAPVPLPAAAWLLLGGLGALFGLRRKAARG
jgi:hypothetical protein